MIRRITKFILVLSTLIIVLVSCQKSTLKIGMIGSLSGKQSQLSIDARNALDIAISQVNENAGVNGQLVELVVKDDESSIDVASKKHKEFIDEGVELVIGHMTSSMTDAVLDSQDGRILFLSPSMSNERLSGIDDFFLRTSPLTNKQGEKFIDTILKTKLKNISILYDLSNREYSTTLSSTIEKLSKDIDDVDVNLIAFDSSKDKLSKVVSLVDIANSDCVFIIAQATDTAFIAQKLKQEKASLTLFSVSWSMTKDLIYNGGKYVDGMYFIGIYESKVKSEEFLNFKKAFMDKFAYEPSFISILTYDSFNMLIEAIKNADDSSPSSVKRSLIDIEGFQGLEEVFKLNEYGDSNRDYLIYKLQNNEFIPLYD